MTDTQQAVSALPVDSGVAEDAFVQIRNLKMHFPVTEGVIVQKTVAHVKAVDGVSFDINRGETLGLVGESGCGRQLSADVFSSLNGPLLVRLCLMVGTSHNSHRKS